MTRARPGQPRLILCPDLDSYVRQAGHCLRSDVAEGGVPVLLGARNGAQLKRVFPGLRSVPAAPDCQPGLTAADDSGTKHGAPDPIRHLLALRPQPGDPARVLIVLASGTADGHVLSALLYGLATGRSIILASDQAEIEAALVGTESAILAGPPALFGKPFLKRLLDRVQGSPRAPRRIGILTGRDAVQACDLTAKLLLAGQRLVPADDDFEFIGAHGNEIHLNYRDGVLCGRASTHAPRTGAVRAGSGQTAFDCGIGCQFGPRYRADAVNARTVFLISCDGFTPSGGFVDASFGLLFALLDGPVAAILAPYKHVQANEALLAMLRAMARSRYPLGEIAYQANARSNHGQLPDHAYLVLGDPDLAIWPQVLQLPTPAEQVATTHGELIRTEARPGQSALTITVTRPPGAQSLAVMPVSENLRAAAPFFALAPVPESDRIDVTLFGAAPLPDGALDFALVEAARPDEKALAAAQQRLRNCRLFAAILGSDDCSGDEQRDLSELLQIAAAFPRPIEAAQGQLQMINLDRLLDLHFARLARALCDGLLERLAARRLWVSQEYVALFARVSRAGPDHDSACPHCANYVTVWRYADPLTSLPTRHMQICDRCGIIADAPAESPLALALETLDHIAARTVPVLLRVTNTGSAPLNASLALQMNRWKLDGIAGEDCRAELHLAPGETAEHRTVLHLPRQFQDDILAIQAFAVTDQLDLVFASQKAVIAVRPR